MYYNGAPAYIKYGYEIGCPLCHAIYRFTEPLFGSKCWFIGHWNGNVPSQYDIARPQLYSSSDNEGCLIPPEGGWIGTVHTYGKGPAPTCRLWNSNGSVATERVRRAQQGSTASQSSATASSSSSNNNIDQIVIEGCGISEANGTYNKSG